MTIHKNHDPCRSLLFTCLILSSLNVPLESFLSFVQNISCLVAHCSSFRHFWCPLRRYLYAPKIWARQTRNSHCGISFEISEIYKTILADVSVFESQNTLMHGSLIQHINKIFKLSTRALTYDDGTVGLNRRQTLCEGPWPDSFILTPRYDWGHYDVQQQARKFYRFWYTTLMISLEDVTLEALRSVSWSYVRSGVSTWSWTEHMHS